MRFAPFGFVLKVGWRSQISLTVRWQIAISVSSNMGGSIGSSEMLGKTSEKRNTVLSAPVLKNVL